MRRGSVEDLLRAATVRVEGGPRPGTGFFVAPGHVLTCAHVVGEDPHAPRIRWPAGEGWREAIPVESVVLLRDAGNPIPALADAYPDVALVTVALAGHPCVAIDDEWPHYGDTFQTYGFPLEGGSVLLTPATLSYRGKKATEPTAFIDLASDTIKPGMSGGALLNLRSNAVCGIVVATRSPASPDGGLAVAWPALRDALGELLAVNRTFHLSDRRWALAAGSARRRRLLFNLPRVVTHFSGRESELLTLAVPDERGIVQSVSGLGGVGKTQLVARFAELHADDFDIVAWIGAQSGAGTQFAELATALELPGSALTAEARAAQVIRWLEHCDERWLLVLDNLPAAESLPGRCPARGNGRVIITSRDRSVEQFGPMLRLDAFDVITGAQYLVARARRPDEHDAARRLSQTLGGLPLALSHAGAYCSAGTRFDDYLELLSGLPAREVFDSTPDVFYERTLAATWHVSIRAAGATAALSLPVLAMAAYLAPDAIPCSLFAVLARDAGALQRKRLKDACRALHRFSLAELSDDALSVHRLVQNVVRGDAEARHDLAGARQALDALTSAFPRNLEEPATWPTCERLVQHIYELAAHVPTGAVDAVKLVGLLHEGCTYSLYAVDDTRSTGIARAALRIALRELGSEHPDTLTARSNLAFAHRLAGRADAAVATSEQAVAGFERVRGPHHRHTLLARQNLAQAYDRAGRVADAIALLERLVADWSRLWPGDSGVNGARAALSTAYRDYGRTADAIEIDRQDVADDERRHGPGHYRSVAGRHHLAVSLLQAGQVDEAISRLEAVLEDTRRLHGREHELTVPVRADLASAYHLAGRSGEAIAETEEVLRRREAELGPLHPTTLLTRSNLAVVCSEGGRTADAVALAERVLAERRELFGPHDPETLMARANLAVFYRQAGRTDEAISNGEAVLDDRTRVLGAEHPDTLRTMDNVAVAYHEAGRLADAIVLGEAAATAAEHHLGAEHPYVARAQRNLQRFRAASERAVEG